MDRFSEQILFYYTAINKLRLQYVFHDFYLKNQQPYHSVYNVCFNLGIISLQSKADSDYLKMAS